MDKKVFFSEVLGDRTKTNAQTYRESCDKQDQLVQEFGYDLGREKHSEWLREHSK